MVLDERYMSIARSTLDILGNSACNEWIANAGMLIQSVARETENKPNGIEEQLAINYFFLKVLETKWGISEEMLELEVKKCFLQMEKIVTDAKARFEEQQAQMVPAEPMIADGVSGTELEGLAAAFGVMAEIGSTDGFTPVVEADAVPFDDEVPADVPVIAAPVESEEPAVMHVADTNVDDPPTVAVDNVTPMPFSKRAIPTNPKDVPSLSEGDAAPKKRRGRPKAILRKNPSSGDCCGGE